MHKITKILLVNKGNIQATQAIKTLDTSTHSLLWPFTTFQNNTKVVKTMKQMTDLELCSGHVKQYITYISQDKNKKMI